MPFDTYAQQTGLSKSALDYFDRSPAHYRDFLAGKYKKESTPEMELGRVLHSLILEDRREWIVRPETYPGKDGDKPWNGNATYCKEWMAEHAGETVLSWNQSEQYEEWASAVRNDADCLHLLSDGKAEQSIFANAFGRWCKGRCDWLDTERNIIVDLKTVADARTETFSRQIHSFGWHRQAALYIAIMEAIGLGKFEWYFIALEKSNPARINVRRLSESAIDLGRCELEKSISQLTACEASNIWPGYSEPGGRIGIVDVPQWAHTRWAADVELQIGGETFKP